MWRFATGHWVSDVSVQICGFIVKGSKGFSILEDETTRFYN
jgi:hypothetical protein